MGDNNNNNNNNIANENIDNNNNNANNENMIMFTPMNGRRAFQRIRREAEEEWMDEGNNFSKDERIEAQKILVDSIKFYLSYAQSHQSNNTNACNDGQILLETYTKNSLHWKVTMQHIIKGMFRLTEQPISCNLM